LEKAGIYDIVFELNFLVDSAKFTKDCRTKGLWKFSCLKARRNYLKHYYIVIHSHLLYDNAGLQKTMLRTVKNRGLETNI
jgi:hypothetical protein